MCCSSARACLSNGLCLLDNTGENTGISYARGTCTDRTWANAACPQRCQLSTSINNFANWSSANQSVEQTDTDSINNSSAYDFRSGGVQVWQCGSEGYAKVATYCCESAAEKTRCCSTATAQFLLPSASIGNALNQTFEAATAATSAPVGSVGTIGDVGPTTVTISMPTPTSGLPIDSDNMTLGQGAKIGIGVGVASVMMIAIAVILFLWIRKQKSKNQNKLATAQDASTAQINARSNTSYELDSQINHEPSASDSYFDNQKYYMPLPSDRIVPVHEMHAVSLGPQELAGSTQAGSRTNTPGGGTSTPGATSQHFQR
jgi:hypothetical protein